MQFLIIKSANEALEVLALTSVLDMIECSHGIFIVKVDIEVLVILTVLVSASSKVFIPKPGNGLQGTRVCSSQHSNIH